VPPQTEAEQPTKSTETKETQDNIYQNSTRYKKCQTSKNKRRGTLAATQDTVIATAHYTKQILENEETTMYDPAEYFCCYAIHPDTGLPAEYKDLRNSSEGAEWIIETADEVGRLAQGNSDTGIKGTDTMFFIHRSEIPKDRKPTYLRIVAADRPNKERTKRIRFTVGGNQIDYPGDVSTKTAQLTTAKLMLNSILSTKDALFGTADIKDFYLTTPMEHYEYMAIPLKDIPQTIIDQYDLLAKAHNGIVYVEIRKGMYGLPQAGRIANEKLIPILEKAGYNQAEHTPGLFTHHW